MSRSNARRISGIMVLGSITTLLMLCGGCGDRQPDAAVSIPDSPGREEVRQPADSNQTEIPEVAHEASGSEAAFFAVMDLSQEAQSSMRIVSKDNLIALRPAGPHTYVGHLDLTVQCDSDVSLTASVAAIRPVRVVGDYSCAVSVPAITAPGGIATVWVKISKAGVGDTPLGSRIATVKLLAASRD